jgi:hypothetical protein
LARALQPDIEALTIAEATGGGIQTDMSISKGEGKAGMCRDLVATVSIKRTGRYPANLGGKEATEAERAWAQNYKPRRSASESIHGAAASGM